MSHTMVPSVQEDSILGARFQAVFPKRVRQVAKKLKPGVILSMIPVSDDTVVVTTKTKDWVKETYGLFGGMWKGDATKRIRKLRDEAWE